MLSAGYMTFNNSCPATLFPVRVMQNNLLQTGYRIPEIYKKGC